MKAVPVVLSLCAAYATVRYNVFAGVSWSEWPVFVLNKACALSSVSLLSLSVVRARLGSPQPSELLPPASLLMLVHLGLSLALLSPAYFAKFFVDGRLTATAGWSVLAGAVAAAFLHRLTRACELSSTASRTVALLTFAVGLHAGLLGYRGWLLPQTWPGYLPPITLLSFLAGTVALAAALWPRPAVERAVIRLHPAP